MNAFDSELWNIADWHRARSDRHRTRAARAGPVPERQGRCMFSYTLRRLLFAIPTLLVISFIIFALLDLAPNDPTGNLPLTIPPEVREQIRASLGLDQPFLVRYLKWLQQFFVNEPLNILEEWTGWTIGDSENRLRVISGPPARRCRT